MVTNVGMVVLIYGKSGSGKSRSLKNFAEDEIFLVNVERKALPFRKKFKYTLNTDNYTTIREQLAKMPLKVAVIDDAGYLITNTFMRGHSAGRGENADKCHEFRASESYKRRGAQHHSRYYYESAGNYYYQVSPAFFDLVKFK